MMPFLVRTPSFHSILSLPQSLCTQHHTPHTTNPYHQPATAPIAHPPIGAEPRPTHRAHAQRGAAIRSARSMGSGSSAETLRKSVQRMHHIASHRIASHRIASHHITSHHSTVYS
ncbi:hypothetical protein VC83_00430 [Pseudogymnoascus destructans]|uniref:Uncharacterized protein n=2 Tax=Pseudogymnoascus destructans TaxID=655981 RepID=L8G906_PSED2|nr:uncharacterized protein VC83_00430 [Pseudogymnoascus destructans]ELR08521.1 hypothetical protein GMDG_03220 [Pseudogymnoascus destructans 20631-21]OAF63161.1 hypothetical protein VC83_00430 [Pseudogymnoascus destructans]